MLRRPAFLALAALATFAASLLLLALGCPAEIHRESRSAAREPIVAADDPTLPPEGREPEVVRPAPPPRPLRHEWTATTTMKEPPFKQLPAGAANVVAHVPEGFDADAPLHLVIYFHGAVQCAPLIANLGDLQCQRGGPTMRGYGFNVRHDAAATRSLFVVPQFALFGGGSAGRMRERGYFTKFIAELVGETFAPGLGAKKTLADVASITLIAHSAGWEPVTAILDGGELDDKVQNVILLDAFFAGYKDSYVRWLERGYAKPGSAKRRFAYVFGPWGDTGGSGKLVADRVRRAHPGDVAYLPPQLNCAARTHAVTIYASFVDHYWMPLIFIPKVLEGLELPPREGSPGLTPVDVARPALPIARGQDVRGRLDDDATALASGAAARDYAVDLAAGVPATITVRGGRSETETCCMLDVVAQLLQDGKVVASDDDGGGGFDSRIALTPASSGAYVVRVTSHGPWRKRGPFTLRIEQ